MEPTGRSSRCLAVVLVKAAQGLVGGWPKHRLVSDRDRILLEQSETDTDFNRLMQIGDPRQLSTETLRDLAKECRGPMLADIHSEAAAEFSAWRLGIVAEAEVRMTALLSELIARLQEAPVEALVWARKLQEIAPFNESAADMIRVVAQQAQRHTVGALPTQPPSRMMHDSASERLSHPERGIVSVCVIDLVSPDPDAAMDVEDEANAIGPLSDLLTTVIGDLGGEIIGWYPAGFAAVFGHRADRQEHTLLACQAARYAQQAVVKAGVPGLAVRAGIDTGEVLIRFAAPDTTDATDISGGRSARLHSCCRHWTRRVSYCQTAPPRLWRDT